MLHLTSDSISPPTAMQHFLLEQPDELKLQKTAKIKKTHFFILGVCARGKKQLITGLESICKAASITECTGIRPARDPCAAWRAEGRAAHGSPPMPKHQRRW